MADITPAKNNILSEEADYRSALSESFFTKLGGSINFINDKQASVHMFSFLGPFRTLSGGEDGGIIFPVNSNLVGITGFIRDSGSSGTTVIDIHRVTTSSNTTILSTKLAIPSTVTAVPFGTNFVDSTTQASGTTLPEITDAANRDFNAFDFLRVDIDSVAVSAKDLILNVWYRPR